MLFFLIIFIFQLKKMNYIKIEILINTIDILRHILNLNFFLIFFLYLYNSYPLIKLIRLKSYKLKMYDFESNVPIK